MVISIWLNDSNFRKHFTKRSMKHRSLFRNKLSLDLNGIGVLQLLNILTYIFKNYKLSKVIVSKLLKESYNN